MLNEVRAAGKFDTSLFTVFGFSPQEYDRLVHNYIIERYRFLFFFSDTYLFWMLGAFLVVAGFIAVRIRIRKREKQMEEEEKAADEIEKLEKDTT